MRRSRRIYGEHAQRTIDPHHTRLLDFLSSLQLYHIDLTWFDANDAWFELRASE